MSRLSQLTKQLNEKTTEQVKATEESLNSVFQAFEQSLKAELQQNQRSISNAIANHEQTLKDQINKTLAYKTAIGSVMGFLLAIILGLGIFSLYLAKNIRTQQAELAEIQQHIEQSPIEAQILAKVNMGKNDNGKFWIETKEAKKTEIGNSTDGKPLMVLE